MRFLMFLLILSGVSLGQLSVVTRIESYTEFKTPPRLIGNRTYYATESKVAEGQMAFVVVTGPADLVRVKAKRMTIVDSRIVVERASVEKIGLREFAITGTGTYTVEVTGFSESDVEDYPEFDITLGALPPKPDDPNPNPKPPGPLTSFRVIFVKESGSTLNPEQTSIPGAKAVRDYLTSKTTPEGGLAGWREYDPQQNVTNEQSKMKAMWAVAKSSLTTIPCLVVERNGKVDVLPYPKNVAETVKTLKGYAGE